MKKIVLILLIAVPTLVFGQRDRNTEMAGKTAPTRVEATDSNPIYFFGEIITMDQQGRTIVRVSFDDTAKNLVGDKDVRVEIDDLARTRFNTLMEALNAASSLGWSLVTTYESESKNSKMTHFVISRKVASMATPALGVRKDAGATDASGKGTRK